MNKDQLARVIQNAIGHRMEIQSFRVVGGGCINRCYKVITDQESYFLKVNQKQYLDMFQAEHHGLEALAQNCDLLVPEVFGTGCLGEISYLLLDFIERSAPATDYWESLATGMAAMHRVTSNNYGWKLNNYIGSLPQSNKWHQGWRQFFIHERLLPQIGMAQKSGLITGALKDTFESLFTRLDDLLGEEVPVFLHGDLWSGNIMTGPLGQPCLVDPAVYFGHREIELAFTTLFGGFDHKFYQAYNSAYPMEPGYRERFELYNLYPLLVHLNLFGGGYLDQILQVLRKFV